MKLIDRFFRARNTAKRFRLALASVVLAQFASPLIAEDDVVYSRSPKFRIPFEFDATELEKLGATEIQLFVSDNNGASWKFHESVKINQSHFLFQSIQDGEYWFSVRTLAAGGLMYPAGPHHAGLKVAIDTSLPRLSVDLEETESGRVKLSWHAVDEHLSSQSLKLERLNPKTRVWELIPVDADSDGEIVWQEDQAGLVEIRASIADRAGNSAVVSTQTIVAGIATPRNETIGRPAPIASQPSSDRSVTTTAEPSHPMTARNELSEETLGESNSRSPIVSEQMVDKNRSPIVQPISETKPSPKIDPAFEDWTSELSVQKRPLATNSTRNPISSESIQSPPDVSKSDAKDTISGSLENEKGSEAEPAESFQHPLANEPSAANSIDSIGSQQANSSPELSQESSKNPPENQSGGNPPAERQREGHLVNSTTFRIGYQIDDVGSTGVESVELYITENEGRQWFHYGSDPDRVSPFQVIVPRDGKYGFTFRIRNGAGLMSPPPQPGEKPEIIIIVDRVAPVARLKTIQKGTDSADKDLLISWHAEDQELSIKPISLYYSTTPNGPWNVIDEAQANNGEYRWKMGEGIPKQFFVHMEVKDAAGNLTRVDSTQPIILGGSQPRAQITNVEPVTAEPNRK